MVNGTGKLPKWNCGNVCSGIASFHMPTPNTFQKSNDADRVQQWRTVRPRRRLHQTCRRLPVFLDRPPTTVSNFFSYSLTLRGCPKKFLLVHSGGLVSSTAHLLILMAALKSRFTNSTRFLPSLVVLTNASSPRTFALLSIGSSFSGPYFVISSGLRLHFSISTL
jgi:hypothetical protein